jgi:putative ABC transport system ATP-binding protein
VTDDPIVVRGLDHYYGEGDLRRQILFGVSVEMHAGEIVIVTGPSGSGKTTLLTLIGALRSAQEGSVRVLGAELRGAASSRLEAVRRQIGYIFQAHNLLDALTASQNVQMALQLDPELPPPRSRRPDSLEGGSRAAGARPRASSGGERQRSRSRARVR